MKDIYLVLLALRLVTWFHQTSMVTGTSSYSPNRLELPVVDL